MSWPSGISTRPKIRPYFSRPPSQISVTAEPFGSFWRTQALTCFPSSRSISHSAWPRRRSGIRSPGRTMRPSRGRGLWERCAWRSDEHRRGDPSQTIELSRAFPAWAEPQWNPSRISGTLELRSKYGLSHLTLLVARPKGFEPLTPRFVVWCSIQLSYGRALGCKGGRPPAGALSNMGFPQRQATLFLRRSRAAKREISLLP
jgi:hypothetical protein